ncbi:MAG TPA: ImmA/IrrE family metallo-endopeptidase [Candidatus Angelobacter sp.]|nr:ImmA/IrrE family metallo-endopeptidase [Candidatus Angelobacter sp.]
MKKNPDQVLKECGITTRPIPLERILERYNIRPIALPASGDIFGAIMRQNGIVTIAVNPDQHLNRQRFTIAHELGHFFRHYSDTMEHVDGDFRVNWRNTASSAGVDWNEIEANRFAAELLMPEKLIRKDVNDWPILDRDVVQHLASLYQVSKIAMQFRLINLGLLPPDVDPSAES